MERQLFLISILHIEGFQGVHPQTMAKYLSLKCLPISKTIRALAKICLGEFPGGKGGEGSIPKLFQNICPWISTDIKNNKRFSLSR